MAKCTFCGRENEEKTVYEGGYETLESCTDCRGEINKDDRVMKITEGLEINKINGLKFGSRSAYRITNGYAFYHKDLGYLSFKEDNRGQDIKVPYIPLGGIKALQSILDTGGLKSYDNIEWLQPIIN